MSELPKADDPRLMQLAQLAELGTATASLLHELRQPLFALKATAQLSVLHRGNIPEDLMPGVFAAIDQMEELLEAYSGFGRPAESDEAFDAREPVGAAVHLLERRARKEGAQVTVEVGPDALYIRGRAGALRQIALNLIGNALDAISGGAARRVEVQLSAGEAVALTVADSGPGVPEDRRDGLFQPFETTKPEGRGTGLGLFIARKLALELGGELSLSFPATGGTVATVTLPRA